MENALSASLPPQAGALAHRRQLRDHRPVLPHVDHVRRRDNHVRLGHRHLQRLDVDVFRVHRATDGVAQDQDILAARVVRLRQHAVVPRRLDPGQLPHVLRVLLVRLAVPEHDAVLRPVSLGEAVHQGVAEVAPLVVLPDVGEVDEGVHRQRDPQRGSFPRQRVDPRPRHLQRP